MKQLTITQLVFCLGLGLVVGPFRDDCIALTVFVSAFVTTQQQGRGDHGQHRHRHRSGVLSSSRRGVNGKRSTDPEFWLDLVDELTTDVITPDLLTKMEQVEQALTNFLETASLQPDGTTTIVTNNSRRPPRPPSIPPPMGAFLDDGNDQRLDQERRWRNTDVQRAEIGLQKLRERLRQEEASLKQAQEALQRSQEEEGILLKAEMALQRSREAAERRKQDALRRTKQAMASAEQARREQEDHAAQVMSKKQQLRRKQAVQHEAERSQNKNETISTSEVTTSKRRKTVSLEGLFDSTRISPPKDDNRKPRPTMMLGELFKNSQDQSSEYYDEYDQKEYLDVARKDIPVLYDWIQDQDGSITGSIRGSSSFREGATVSTSSVALGVRDGTTITTSSGSQYYLAGRSDSKISEGYVSIADKMFQVMKSSDSLSSEAKRTNIKKQSQRRTKTAPNGVPIIRAWRLNSDGGISGVIFRSESAVDGDYIETSCLDITSIAESGYVVQTISGSQYYLCDEPVEADIPDLKNLFQGFVPFRRSGTITISKTLKSTEPRKDVNEAMNTLARSKPRTTFSLFDLLGAKPKKSVRPPTRGSVPDGQVAPVGVPTLMQWTYNDDGTVSGTIFGSSSIRDGNLINTSPIARGVAQRFQVVTTESGSAYFLG